MKRTILFTAILVSFFAIAGTVSAAAQTGVRLERTPKAFQVFFLKFKRGVVAKQRTAVASMTEFPFRYGYDAGDEGKYTRAQFIKNFNKLFYGDEKPFDPANIEFRCDAKECVVDDMSDASHYIFKKRGTTYKFTAFISEP